MFSWLRRIFSNGEDFQSGGALEGDRRSSEPEEPPASRQHLVDSLDDLIKTPGKACYRTLVELTSTSTKDDFRDLVHCPAFVGSGIRDGELERVSSPGQGGKWQKTQMFNPSMRALLIEGASIEQSIFLLRKPMSGPVSELKKFTIGRTQDNDILMNDFAISRSHAVVEIRGENYYLKDLGSSNGTFVNGKLIDDRGTLLENGDAVRFARYEFQFLAAEELFELLKRRSTSAMNRVS